MIVKGSRIVSREEKPPEKWLSCSADLFLSGVGLVTINSETGKNWKCILEKCVCSGGRRACWEQKWKNIVCCFVVYTPPFPIWLWLGTWLFPLSVREQCPVLIKNHISEVLFIYLGTHPTCTWYSVCSWGIQWNCSYCVISICRISPSACIWEE